MRHFARTGKRTWSLIDQEGKSLGTLVQPKWWSQRMELLVPEGALMVTRSRMLSSGITAFLNDLAVIELKFPWNGGMRMRSLHVNGPELLIKRKSWFGEVWSVTDMNGVERARIKHKMNWSRFEREPVLEAESDEPISALQLLMAVHGINTNHRRASAAS